MAARMQVTAPSTPLALGAASQAFAALCGSSALFFLARCRIPRRMDASGSRDLVAHFCGHALLFLLCTCGFGFSSKRFEIPRAVIFLIIL